VYQGYTYRYSRYLTEVSFTTIGRVVLFMERGAGGYRTALERIRKELT
jgi:uncharacterized protein YerC